MKDSTVFVGLDAHKKEHKIAVFPPGCDTPEEWTVRNDPAEIDRWVHRMQRKFASLPIVVAYEAGVCGFALQRQIQRPGVKCVVIAPSLVPIRPGERVRTDRRDAAGLGRHLRNGALTEVQPPTPKEEAVRDLCRCREAVMRDLRRVRHQVLKFLLRYARHYSEGDHWTKKHRAWLGTIRLEEALAQEVLTVYLRELEHRQSLLEDLDRRLEAKAQEEPYRAKVGWLRCLQGVDTVTALNLTAELYAPERFESARSLMHFLGLTPSEASSGETVRKGPITKAGNSRVRRLLLESAWHQRRRATASKALKGRRRGQPAWAVAIAERAQERLHRRFWRLLGQGKAPNVAATAVARELSGFAWALLQGPPRGRREDAADSSRCRGGACSPPAATGPSLRKEGRKEGRKRPNPCAELDRHPS